MHDRRITQNLAAICLPCLFLLITSPIQSSAAWISQTYKAGPVDNPLKGFMPYHGSFTTFPCSMEWQYLAWKDLQTDSNTFTWAPLDNLLNEVAARGHQLVFRIYADYPTEPYGVPAFLSSVPKNSYTDYGNTTSFSPDYDNADLRRAMHNLIVALGKRYDGDPRIGFITVGLIGFWGEWHTYRPSCNCDTWMPSTAVLDEVLGAFDSSFTKTKILMRMPKGTNAAARSIGYHDDSFNYETYGATSWFFWPAIVAAGSQNKWRTEAIGGELRPEIQLTTWQSADQCVTGGDGNPQCFNTAVDTTHASWMIAHALFEPGNSGTEHARALAGSQRMGYDLFVSSVNLPDTVRSDSLQVSIKIQNRGVAPFYYDWPVQLAAFDNGRHLVAVWPTAWRLTSVIDRNTDVAFSVAKYPHGLAAGTYTVLMRAVNPLTNGKTLCFANTAWAQDTAGWLTLGSCVVASSSVSMLSSVGPGRKGSLPQFAVIATGRTIRFECSRPAVVSLYDLGGRCAGSFSLQNEMTWKPPQKEGLSMKIFLAVARDGSRTIAKRLIVVK